MTATPPVPARAVMLRAAPACRGTVTSTPPTSVPASTAYGSPPGTETRTPPTSARASTETGLAAKESSTPPVSAVTRTFAEVRPLASTPPTPAEARTSPARPRSRIPPVPLFSHTAVPAGTVTS